MPAGQVAAPLPAVAQTAALPTASPPVLLADATPVRSLSALAEPEPATPVDLPPGRAITAFDPGQCANSGRARGEPQKSAVPPMVAVNVLKDVDKHPAS